MKWLACELHTHTLHSDGSQTLQELAEGAVRLGFDAIALTDHNTMSGLIGKEDIEQQTGLMIVPGMEWTTFYGHMVTIGLSEFADWRQADPGKDRTEIDRGISEVHRLGGLAGLAHPFRIGSPACTGCFWEYEIEDWSAVDYIEVWSGTFPSIQTNNRRAYDLWTQKLNEGYRIAATSGRDWHNQTESEEPISVTYLGVEEQGFGMRRDAHLLTEEAPAVGIEAESTEGSTAAKMSEELLIAALRQGQASVTLGPLLTLRLEIGDGSYPIGTVVPTVADGGESTGGSIGAVVTLDGSVRRGLWAQPEHMYRLKLCSNLGEEFELEAPVVHDGQPMHFHTVLPAADSGKPRIWMRAEAWGTLRGAHVRLAFTNAIYFEEGGHRP